MSNAHSVIYFVCPGGVVARRVIEYAGGFEIVSASVVAMIDHLGVLLVLKGPEDRLRAHEAELAERLGTRVQT